MLRLHAVHGMRYAYDHAQERWTGFNSNLAGILDKQRRHPEFACFLKTVGFPMPTSTDAGLHAGF